MLSPPCTRAATPRSAPRAPALGTTHARHRAGAFPPFPKKGTSQGKRTQFPERWLSVRMRESTNFTRPHARTTAPSHHTQYNSCFRIQEFRIPIAAYCNPMPWDPCREINLNRRRSLCCWHQLQHNQVSPSVRDCRNYRSEYEWIGLPDCHHANGVQVAHAFFTMLYAVYGVETIDGSANHQSFARAYQHSISAGIMSSTTR